MKPSNLRYLFLFIFLLWGQLGLCCINEYGVLLDGTTTASEGGNAAPRARLGLGDKSNLLKKLYGIYKATGKIEDYSDYGAMLIYNGRYNEGKKVFQEIERKSPGLYATAANLGTTYELLGLNDSAYFWIKKAIKINPTSHRGSEWIHLKILEAKIKSKNDPAYFKTHSILSLDFGNTKSPVNNGKRDLEILRGQLYHQLSERMSFIKPRDIIVGQLLFDLGNINAITRDVKSGLQVYEVAKEYGFQSELLYKREKYFKSLQRIADFENYLRQNPFAALLIVVALLKIFIVGLILIVIRIQRNVKI